jgi:hypothetical protein
LYCKFNDPDSTFKFILLNIPVKINPMNKQRNFIERVSGKICKLVALLFFILLSTVAAYSQRQDSTRSIFKGGSYDETFSTSRIGLAQSVMTTPKGEFHVVIQHRFAEIETGAYNFFGMDGAIPRVGFDYGITNWLSAGIGRSLFEKTFDLELKAVILKQNGSNVPVSLSYFVSVMDNTSKDYFPAGNNSFGSRLSFANQFFISRKQGIFSAQVAPVWMHNDYEIRTGGKLDVFGLDIAGRIGITEKIGFIAEYINVLTRTDFTGTNPLTLGIDINTGGHQFQLIFSNSQGLNEKSYLTDTFGSWSKGHIYFGFNLTRVFNRKLD